MRDTAVKIEARDASAGYGREPVIREISFTLHPGQLLCVLGPNGAGKSTLLKTIAGQLPASSGNVLLNGEELKNISPGKRAQSLSLLMTERPDAELMTCREVASAGRYPYTGILGILSEKDKEIVDRSMERMGASSLADRPFMSLSDGQKQRVLLARALCQEPEVLILDEPASFLDIRYQLELSSALRSLADEGLCIIVSMHDLDLARRTATHVLTVKEGKADRYGTASEILTDEYLEKLFDLEPGSLGREISKPENPAGKAGMRYGYTTGTCAALAASACTTRLLAGIWPETVSLLTPKGVRVSVVPQAQEEREESVSCGIIKDAGDDPDVTGGIMVCAEVSLVPEPGVVIRGGEGVGTVTKPGLDQKVGEAAINSVPRKMITEAVMSAAEQSDYDGGFLVTISVPGGKELSEKTFNPKLGISGGISILGTSGIVEPMSLKALSDTIVLEIRQKAALGEKRLILTPGNYGERFLAGQGLILPDIPIVKCSNFIGDALDEISKLPYEEVLLAGHLGKFVKLAGGIMNTHSSNADCRMELITAHAAICGARTETCRQLMQCISTDACVEVLKEAGLLDEVMESLLSSIRQQVAEHLPHTRFGVMIFSAGDALLGKTAGTDEIINEWRS